MQLLCTLYCVREILWGILWSIRSWETKGVFITAKAPNWIKDELIVKPIRQEGGSAFLKDICKPELVSCIPTLFHHRYSEAIKICFTETKETFKYTCCEDWDNSWTALNRPQSGSRSLLSYYFAILWRMLCVLVKCAACWVESNWMFYRVKSNISEMSWP